MRDKWQVNNTHKGLDHILGKGERGRRHYKLGRVRVQQLETEEGRRGRRACQCCDIWHLGTRPERVLKVPTLSTFWLTPLALGELPWKATDKNNTNNNSSGGMDWGQSLKHNTLWSAAVGKMYHRQWMTTLTRPNHFQPFFSCHNLV